MDTITRALAEARYVSLTTFRRSGEPVATPVWVVGDGGSLGVWTVRDSGKVKRIRREPAVEVAPCDVRGNPYGPPVPARARILDREETARIRQLLLRKYGLLGRTLMALSRWRRGEDATVGISITLSAHR